MAFEIKSASGDYLVRGVVMNQGGSLPGRGIMVLVTAHEMKRQVLFSDWITDENIKTERRAEKIAEQRARTLAGTL